MSPPIEVAVFLSESVYNRVILDLVNWKLQYKKKQSVNLTCYTHTFSRSDNWHKFVTFKNPEEFPLDAHIYEIIIVDWKCVRGSFHASFLKLFNVHERVVYIYDDAAWKKRWVDANTKCLLFEDVGMEDQLQKKLEEYFPKLFRVDAAQYNVQIPKIVHLMWLSKDGRDMYPEKYERNIQRWQQFNPNYQIIVWNNSTTEKLVRDNYPQYYDVYEKLTPLISKCDFARMCVLGHYGGVYVDMDFHCRRPLDALLHDKEIVLSEEISEHQKITRVITNGIVAATKRHWFIVGWIDHMAIATRKCGYTVKIPDVVATTGPEGLWRYYKRTGSKVPLVDCCIVMPYTTVHTLSRSCKRNIDPFMYTVWTEGSGWDKDTSITDGYSTPVLVAFGIGLFLILVLVAFYLYTGRRIGYQ